MKNLFESKWTWGAVAIVIIISMLVIHKAGYASGQDELTAEVNEEKLNYEQLLEQIEDKQKELDDVKANLKETQNKFNENKEEFDELKKLRDNRDKIEQEVEKNESTLADLKVDISIAQDKLASLTGKIEKTGDDPINMGAGMYTFGEDLPSGRYEVFPDGQGSNFVVRDEFGELLVNQILGSNGVPSYVFEVYDGATVETEAPVKFVPVE